MPDVLAGAESPERATEMGAVESGPRDPVTRRIPGYSVDDVELRLVNDFGPLFQAPSVPCQTSEDAASAIQPRLNHLRARVLTYIVNQGARGATDEEIATALEMNPSTARPRRIELELVKRIVKASFTRATRSGRQAQVWLGADVA